MSSQPSAAAATNPKPVLNGVRLKARKSEKKATKFEPTTFRDALFKLFEETDCTDLANVSAVLDGAGDDLDYRRYAEPFFEILYSGYVLAPGGAFVEDEAGRSPFCIFTTNATIEDMRKAADVFVKLIRRYKYLQVSFEEATGKMLQYINKWSAEDLNKFAIGLGVLIAINMLPINVLTNLIKDHLVKEGISLDFVTAVLKTYLSEQTIEQFGAALRKTQLENQLLEFFPPNKRSEEQFASHFASHGLEVLVDFHKKRQVNTLKDSIASTVADMIKKESSVAEVCTYMKQQLAKVEISDQEIVRICWESVMKTFDLSMKSDQIDQLLLRHLNAWSKFLGAFIVTPKAQLYLICRIQLHLYEDARFTKHFRNVVTLLYKTDVVSENAILYWYEKGAAPQGKNVFTAQLEPFVNWLREAESEEDEEEEEK